MSGSDTSKKPFSREEQEQLAKLAEMRDEDIDTSDIPEISDEAWAKAERRVPGHRRPAKVS